MRPRITLALALIAATLLATGCGIFESEDHMRQRLFAELMQRPDSHEALARYEKMYDEVRAAVATAFPHLGTWKASLARNGSSCADPYGQLNLDLRTDDAEELSLENWVATGGLDEPQWRQADTIVRDIAQRYGFTDAASAVSRPGNHEIALYDSYGTELNFGTATNTTLLLRTGCFLTPEAKRRGTPAERITY